ncbi:hypothetical protein [Pyxidicoccus sp. MSG2]|uniref:hypothetical protein n=1 Tax=Pyxidicoccus sp. MSG2 TaxID=2996790 RepID=UPI002270F0DC|nr:hypothetical protein [Pyxidicoccus sp. MSG2]MCY1021478.1 hypothetical protein [Pyxidicoccus sp. MSG2]
MGYGVVSHLWIHGNPDGTTVSQWLDVALRTSFQSGYEFETVVADAYRFGPALTLVDVQPLGKLTRSRSASKAAEAGSKTDFLTRVAELAAGTGLRCTRIWMGDLGDMSWELEVTGTGARPIGARMQDAELSTLGPRGWSEDSKSPSVARDIIRGVVSLPLVEVHHYIDWALATRDAIEKSAPVEGFDSTLIARLLSTRYLVWKGRALQRVMTAEEMAPELAGALRLRTARSLVQPVLVWSLVVTVAVIVPAVLYHFIFAPPVEGPKVGLVLGGLITSFWLLFSLVGFDDFKGAPVRWPRRAALLVGGELAMALLMWVVHGAPS